MISPFIAMGFGLLVIAGVFLTIVFFRAYWFALVEIDDRYRTVVVSLIVGTIGVSIWALNPLKQALGLGPLNGWLMFFASLLILGAMTGLIGSTAIGGTKTMLNLFLATAAVWVISVLVLEYLL